MYGRLAAMAVLFSLAACANLQPAGRNARNGEMEAPPPRVATTTPRTAPVLPPPSASLPPPATSPAYTPRASAPLATPPSVTAAAPPVASPPVTSAPPVVAPSVAAPAADRPPPRRSNDEEVVVPGTITRQIQPPNGDPRTEAERMQDINSWDRCVTHVQAAFESDPMRPQLQSPEEYCSQSLGMADRTAVPISRQSRRPSR